MDFLTLSSERYSVRKFKSDAIQKDVLDKILRAGHVAPTACNYQPQRIFVINSTEGLEKLKGCTRCHFDAPCALLVCYNKNECWMRKYDGETSGFVDASIVTTHMMLAAWEEGIGSTWVMHFNPEKIIAEFQLPEEIVPVALLPMGYAADDAAPIEMHSTFRNMDEVVKYV